LRGETEGERLDGEASRLSLEIRRILLVGLPFESNVVVTVATLRGDVRFTGGVDSGSDVGGDCLRALDSALGLVPGVIGPAASGALRLDDGTEYVEVDRRRLLELGENGFRGLSSSVAISSTENGSAATSRYACCSADHCARADELRTPRSSDSRRGPKSIVVASITADGNNALAQLESSSGVVAAESGSKAAACPACMDNAGDSHVNDRGEVAVPKLEDRRGPNAKAPPPS
jgi:hypothetical protein